MDPLQKAMFVGCKQLFRVGSRRCRLRNSQPTQTGPWYQASEQIASSILAANVDQGQKRFIHTNNPGAFLQNPRPAILVEEDEEEPDESYFHGIKTHLPQVEVPSSDGGSFKGMSTEFPCVTRKYVYV